MFTENIKGVFIMQLLRKLQLLLVVLVITPSICYASLASDVSSINTDAQLLNGSVSKSSPIIVNSHELLNVYTINLSIGQILEYENPTNKQIVAITWHTKRNPNIRQLLGSYFVRLQQQPTQKLGHSQVRYINDDFIFTAGGVLNDRYAKAILVQALPTGIRIEDIK